MDELPAYEGDQCSEYNKNVGYVLGARLPSFSNLITLRTLQAEGPDAFSQFHLYVCSAFLVKWSDKLRQMDFQVRTSW